jgi:hypothetical protein
VNLDEVVEGLDLSVLGRAAWERDQAVRDLELLWWIGRFRFVTADAIGERFGISLQRANSRVRRLEKLRLVETWQRSVCEPRAVFLTGRTMELLGQPRRRAPRPDMQREHEAAIVWLCSQLEREQPEAEVRTERECRRRERAEVERYSVEVFGGGYRSDRRRWPDIVVEHQEHRTAVEIEFAAKGRARLERIVNGYVSSCYDEVVFYVRAVAVGRVLRELVWKSSPWSPLFGEPKLVRIEPWLELGPARQDTFRAAVPPLPLPEPPAPPPPPPPPVVVAPEPPARSSSPYLRRRRQQQQQRVGAGGAARQRTSTAS